MASHPKVPRTDNEVIDVASDIDNELLENVDAVQEAIDNLNKEASNEILKVEQKYNVLRKPHYKERGELLSKIPNFWLTVLMNHLQIRKFITEEDEKVLASLRSIEVQENEDITSGYKILLYFNENDYFKNDVITKDYRVGEKGEPTATNMKIEWKPKMCLTATNNEKNAMKRLRQSDETFFYWLTDVCDPVGDIIGESIKEEIWPNPLQFYLNPEIDTDDLEDEDDDDEDEEDGAELNYEENPGADEPSE